MKTFLILQLEDAFSSFMLKLIKALFRLIFKINCSFLSKIYIYPNYFIAKQGAL